MSKHVMPITIDPRIHHGEPVITGTRVPVRIVVGSLAGGMTFVQVQDEYAVTADQIRAALKFAAEQLEHSRYYPLSA